jgi:hypothetical protein
VLREALTFPLGLPAQARIRRLAGYAGANCSLVAQL